uniref:SLC26A/SulP transporter domain-containing protein n=1 Tax=Timema douglasi TaxID=61478 RepID=A0A7R8Z9W3_TIMDO|nr:unnamed protein product [Timema douglasi]
MLKNVLAHNLQVWWPVLDKGTVWVARYCEVVDQCIQPHIYCLVGVSRNSDAPVNTGGGPRDRYILVKLQTTEADEVYPHLHGGRVESKFEKTILNTPDQNINLSLPVIEILAYYDSSSMEHAAIEAGCTTSAKLPTPSEWHRSQEITWGCSCTPNDAEKKPYKDCRKEILNGKIPVLAVLRRYATSRLFSEFNYALKMLSTIPVTSAAYEKSYSKLSIVKSKLRTTVTQNLLECLVLPFIEQETAVNLLLKTSNTLHSSTLDLCEAIDKSPSEEHELYGFISVSSSSTEETTTDQEENGSISESNNSWTSPVKSFFRCEGKAFCSRSYFGEKIPITKWLPKYSRQDAIHDIIASLTVSLTVIPQGIAIAVLSGLQPQYGLYSAFMGPFVYVLFGSCKDITVGPTALLALMTQSLTTRCGTDFVMLLTFLSGCVISMLGILRMGFLIDFISLPVSSAFTSAAAITIATSQINGLLGIKGNPQDFISAWELFSSNTNKIKRWDTIIGVSSVIVLLLTRFRLGERHVHNVLLSESPESHGLADICSEERSSGEVAGGLPSLHLPPFSTTYNGTQYSFVGMANEMGILLFLVPLISILESIAIAKAFANIKSVDATQEMLALGLINVLGSFVGSMPVTGSFTRTAVNNASGVRTQLGGIITGTCTNRTID